MEDFNALNETDRLSSKGSFASHPKRILVVDDEKNNRLLLSAMLKTLGHESEEAEDGPEAIAKLSSNIDLILLDIMMPVMDGFEVTRKIREDPLSSDVPIIMVTSLTSKEDRLQAVQAGANDFISKPVDKVELRVRMDSLLKMKEAQDAIKQHRAELEVMVEKRTAALVQSERRYRTLFQDSLDAIFVATSEGEIVDVNQAFLDLFGYTRREATNVKSPQLFADPAEEMEFRRIIERDGHVRGYEWKVRARNGKERDCLLTASVRRAPDGAAIGYQGIVHDVTERRRAVEALRESEERMRLLIEASPIGIMIAQYGKCSYGNPAFVEMFACGESGEILGSQVGDLFVPEDRDTFHRNAEKVAAGAEPSCYFEIRGLKKSGHPFEVSVWLTTMVFAGVPSLLVFLVDVSEEKALKTRLAQAQKLEALGTLAGGIAHDFNNILYAITGFAELCLGDVSNSSRLYSNLTRILEASDRAAGVVKQILTFSRQGEQERRPIQISPIVKETIKFLRASVPASIEIRQKIEPKLGNLMADPTQIHQVVMNLCTNAAHAMLESGGTLTVILANASPEIDPAFPLSENLSNCCLRLSVSDTGCGMTPELLERIFEPYFTTKRPGEGTGLGLAQVHGIVESHDGTIKVESEPGKGTTFRLYFPVIKEEEMWENDTCDECPTGTERILLVDDEPSLVLMGKRMLESLGYRVVTSSNSRLALEVFNAAADQFDLVITDLTMPNLGGPELAEAVHKKRPELPVIVCTGFNDPLTESEIHELGIQALILKPVLKSKLAVTIRRLLDQSVK